LTLYQLSDRNYLRQLSDDDIVKLAQESPSLTELERVLVERLEAATITIEALETLK